MSLIQRSAQPPQRGTPIFRWIAIGCFSAMLFLLTICFGSPSDATLDASWTEVLGWATLKHAQWGRDIVFTYGPLGFLHGTASYVPGILGWFVTGQIVLTVAFVLTTSSMLHRSRAWVFFLFAVAYAFSYPWIPSDVSWAITLLFGTTAVMNCDRRRAKITLVIVMVFAALLFGAIALIKFSLLPLWILCVIAIAADSLIHGSWRRALWLLVVFPAALLFAWVACGQDLGNLPAYLRTSFEVAAGYGHTMGKDAPLIVELAGAACVGFFGLLCLFAAYQARRDISALAALALYMAAAFLAWRANFTRADHAHWFFAFFSLLPFALLSHHRLAQMKRIRGALILLALSSATAGLYGPIGVSARWQQLRDGFSIHAHLLANVSELRAQRESQWAAAQQNAKLPNIRRRVGSATVDLLTLEQGVVLLNELNYAPRPVFQSYAAYTPYLAGLNEAYFLGPQAPEFAVMQLDTIDGRLPTGDDSLALIALMQRYRPVLLERGFLLLQRDAEITIPAPITPPTSMLNATLGTDVPITASQMDPTIAFVKLDLSLLGRAYTALLREPPLRIVTQTDKGEYDDRFIRPAGASGFILSPMIRSTQDWMSLHLGSPLSHVRSIRIQAETSWQSIFFQREFIVGFQTQPFQRGTPAGTPSDLVASIYPGFNVVPTEVQGISELIVEDGKSALFLHAPGTLRFAPAPLHYRVSGEFGIRSAALTTPACSAADGIGVSLLRLHQGAQMTLLHIELDPFHILQDRGPHQFNASDVEVEAGDTIEFLIDPGHGGSDTACDWSYVRNLTFEPSADQGGR